MKLPFTKEQFLEVFRKYNITFFPLQLLFLLLAAYIIFLAVKGKRNRGSTIAISLGCLWLWMGAAYHLAFFTVINKAAYGFGALFLLQGILLIVYGLKASPSFVFEKNLSGILGSVLLFYALIIYPLLGYADGHGYPYSPTFGLPCPTTIFTLAIFLLAPNRLPFYIVAIPLLWSVIGFSAAFTLGIYEDTGLVVSALVFAILHFTKPKRLTAKPAHKNISAEMNHFVS
ncbi:MAG: hypothetical protein ICV79_10555 [Flavisolibacter sp.]|nr:hypothetical protein [Flavisolibacter sp.]